MIGSIPADCLPKIGRHERANDALLAAYASWFPAKTVFLCVVDPGVGGTRPAIIIEVHGSWHVGPGNGLFELVQRRAGNAQGFDIDWKPAHLSPSFHGRDLFAPVAAMLASHCQADLARIMTTVVQIGPAILRKSSMSIISATP